MCGFTLKKITLHCWITSQFSVVQTLVMERQLACSLSKCGPETAVMESMTLKSMRPLAMAKAIFPPPMNPIFVLDNLSLNSVAMLGKYDEGIL